MATATESPFLKKFEGRISVMNKDGVIGTAEDMKSRRNRINNDGANRQLNNNNNTPAPIFMAPSPSHGSTIVHSSSEGTSGSARAKGKGSIRVVHRSILDNFPDTLPSSENPAALPPLRPHPLIFDNNNNSLPKDNNTKSAELSLEHLRRVSSENKYKDYSLHTPNLSPSPSTSALQPISSNHPPTFTPPQHAPYVPSTHPPPTKTALSSSANANATPIGISPSKPRLRNSTGTTATTANNISNKNLPTSSHIPVPSSSYPSTQNSQLSPSESYSWLDNRPPLAPHPQPVFPQPTSFSQIPSTMYYTPTPTDINNTSYATTSATSMASASSSSPRPSNSSATYSPTLSKDGVNKEGKEQLYYSKQPREVYYKPHNIEDYRRLKDEFSGVKLGNLGPDLQREEYLVKKEQTQKMKEYAKNVRALHHMNGPPTGPTRLPKSTASTPDSERRAAKEKRAKAKEYASKIPKPAQPRPTNDDATQSTDFPGGEYTNDDDDDDMEGDSDLALLREMERRHHVARADVLQIRKEFGLT